jgi:hypothetical protein
VVLFLIQNGEQPHFHTKIKTIKMGWAETWNDILSGGSTRWKVTDETCHNIALNNFQSHLKENPSNVSVFCPLAGDDPFIHLLFSKGYSVTTIDLVPAAVERMKEQFISSEPSSQWTKQENDQTVIWEHSSGRATLMVGDALQKRAHLKGKFDAVYDKDSFGALPIECRQAFCDRIAEYIKPGGILYLECKRKDNHEQVKDQGPPYSLTKEELMQRSNYGRHFQYNEYLGDIYPISMTSAKQTGHILQRTFDTL